MWQRERHFSESECFVPFVLELSAYVLTKKTINRTRKTFNHCNNVCSAWISRNYQIPVPKINYSGEDRTLQSDKRWLVLLDKNMARRHENFLLLSEMLEHLNSCFLGLGTVVPLNMMLRWILTSQTWSPEEAEKRARQINFILNNEDRKRSEWFYCDLDHGKLLYLKRTTETVNQPPTAKQST